ncbi:serine/threonine-protein phosphatase 2A activator-like protein [Dinothrombium tinctorium]|uniref:Serine/threonine-protein phosphatase 2A activator n=1 Tax=Dinothrombium tinctorium TaxID=1965070 RepID=A0A443RB75_9ACAR|nr:serine/threonine-protein phosphatase 2A activator-like protein [Dinothrombium tinctorium]RWS11692.1 serine/threonine-protein phosphatase 2A activator-like protein [Dinothrombium tinctorium]RWS12521.1 serine/threonine-protein phosphatase 2A activator-like protein [Dinothrombium tinctorium]
MSVKESTVCKRILSVNDMDHWTKVSPAYRELIAFIKQINEFAKGCENAFYDVNTIANPKLAKTVKLLQRLRTLVDEVKPLQDDKNQRFGNKAFRVWFEKMKLELDEFFEEGFSADSIYELRLYLEESFGNQQRIDYGTGHELSFIIFLMGLYKLELVKGGESEQTLRKISHEILTVFAAVYMPLVRSIQLQYRLEPAGSHGVYSLDDFQFLPFLFGSAQLVGHPTIEPKNFYEPDIFNAYADKYMFHAAIQFIHKVKTGPFHEHSNQLWNISGVDSWLKINRGLLRMYQDEVLGKFPIVQHIVFGEKVLKWE